MKNSLRTLYVSDLDGTLLNTDSRISKRTSEIITGLTDRGALITVATARTPATVVPLMSHTRTSVPAIVMTGAATWCRKSNRFITTRIMSHRDAAHISQTMAGCGISPFFYTLPRHKRHDCCPALEVYHNAYRPTHAEQKFIDERIDMPLKRFYLNTPLPENAADRIMLIFGMAPIERIK
ncbi:MAG: HAD hydrolase family protein, partial [Muribaculaceae bacterium]|nr:HAD hydrolase family protein [Muribaculaceae bacterium]